MRENVIKYDNKYVVLHRCIRISQLHNPVYDERYKQHNVVTMETEIEIITSEHKLKISNEVTQLYTFGPQ